ncbi:hypothetical protein N0V88_000458 [Collariella sp. IMI 366227]|nr:hypothetical protein N0V88_000458 [Collariella sp. IMI 366227]
MARPKITLYVDTVSPFGYIAYYLLRHEEAFKACDITYVPILLGGLMNKCGNTPPLKIKILNPHHPNPPARLPAPTLPIMRVLCAVEASDKENANNGKNLTRALDTFYARYWVDAVATHKPEGFKETLEGLFGRRKREDVRLKTLPLSLVSIQTN